MSALLQPVVETDVSGPTPILCLDDAIAGARAICDAIGATDFALFSIGAARDRGRLTPIFDSDHPNISTQSRILSSSLGDDIVRRSIVSTLPTWWSGERESLSTRSLGALRHVQSSLFGLPDEPGIAFPVFGQNGTAGLFGAFGTEIALSDADLPAVHGSSFALFSATLRLPLPQDGDRPPMLPPRDLDMLRLTANGYTSEEIAIVLNLSVHTTNQYLTKVTTKLNAVSRMHAVAKALRLGLIE
jgi:DNA-binding CsgD family transcriptional regulator